MTPRFPTGTRTATKRVWTTPATTAATIRRVIHGTAPPIETTNRTTVRERSTRTGIAVVSAPDTRRDLPPAIGTATGTVVAAASRGRFEGCWTNHKSQVTRHKSQSDRRHICDL